MNENNLEFVRHVENNISIPNLIMIIPDNIASNMPNLIILKGKKPTKIRKQQPMACPKISKFLYKDLTRTLLTDLLNIASIDQQVSLVDIDTLYIIIYTIY